MPKPSDEARPLAQEYRDSCIFGGDFAKHENFLAARDNLTDWAVEEFGVERLLAEVSELRGALLDIFARCDDWSSVDIKAAIADALKTTIAELEQQLDEEDEE